MIFFHQGRYVFDEFNLTMDFEIARNTITAVIGPSGAGKSTLLSIIAGFDHLNSGYMQLNGLSADHLSPAQRPVSMVFQDHNTFPHLSVFENVALGISPQLDLTDAQRQIIRAALHRVELSTLQDRKPGDMSGGERQRVAIARALVRDRPILLLDEPFAALGPALRKNMLDLISELQREKQLTVLIVTHDPEDAQRMAQQIIFVDQGVVRAPVSTHVFFNTPDDAVKSYLG
jgi:thiamine transport system ATP-binding protein